MKFFNRFFWLLILSLRVQAVEMVSLPVTIEKNVLCGKESKDLFKDQHIVFARYELAGFFACMNVVIGSLDAYEAGEIGGLTVDFGKTGLYYDANRGNNWWRYYFKPLSIGSKTLPRVVQCDCLGMYAGRTAYGLTRERCKNLIDKHIHIRKSVNKKVKLFIKEKMHGKKYVSVQYRGTDKFAAESTFVSQENAINFIDKTLRLARKKKCKIFVATDVHEFVKGMRNRFGKRVVCLKAQRSRNGLPVHFRNDISGYEKGMDALVDCLLLSKSTLLIRTASNLSNTALLFNPKLKSVLLNRSLWPDR